MTQKAEPRFYKVESRVMQNNSQGLGLSHKQKHGNMHQTKFQQNMTALCLSHSPLQNARICLSFDLLLIQCCVWTDDLFT